VCNFGGFFIHGLEGINMSKIKQCIQISLIVTCVLAGVTSIAWAAQSVILNHYEIDFIEMVGDGTTRLLTYAITADGDEVAPLSEWTLAVSDGCFYKFPSPKPSQPGTRSYKTPDSYILQDSPSPVDICADGYQCKIANYEVVQADDPGSNLRKITFKNADVPLSAGNPGTHLFQIVVHNDYEHRKGNVTVTVGAGGFASGQVLGPVCPPTAVQLVSLTGDSPTSLPLMGGLLGILLIAIALAAALKLRAR
jgi:hypothetical protein